MQQHTHTRLYPRLYLCTQGGKKFKNQKHNKRSRRKISLMRSSSVVIVILQTLKDVKTNPGPIIGNREYDFSRSIHYFNWQHADCYPYCRSACRTFARKCPRGRKEIVVNFSEIARHVSIKKVSSACVCVCSHHTIIGGQRQHKSRCHRKFSHY